MAQSGFYHTPLWRSGASQKELAELVARSDQWSCMKTAHDRIQDLPMKKAKESRPTREEILEGIAYTQALRLTSRYASQGDPNHVG
jgi:hypothetical protein